MFSLWCGFDSGRVEKWVIEIKFLKRLFVIVVCYFMAYIAKKGSRFEMSLVRIAKEFVS